VFAAHAAARICSAASVSVYRRMECATSQNLPKCGNKSAILTKMNLPRRGQVVFVAGGLYLSWASRRHRGQVVGDVRKLQASWASCI